MGFRHVKATIYTEDDFFENYLVKVDEDIDSNKFIVADGGYKIFNPTKKKYFKLFNLNDFKNKIKFEGKVFSLTINLVGGEIVIKRDYGNHIKELIGSIALSNT